MNLIYSHRGEVAVRSIMSLLATGRRIAARRQKKFGRLRGTEGVVAAQPAEYMTLPHIVAVAEEFSRTSLISLAQDALHKKDRFHLALLQRGEMQAEGSWESMQEAWTEWFGIQIGKAPDYSRLDAYIVIRNTIVHGLGTLTRRQTRSDGGKRVKAKLAGVNVSLVGDRIVLPFSAVEDCAKVAAHYVEWLDSELADLG
jgi:hypothetical protein